MDQTENNSLPEVNVSELRRCRRCLIRDLNEADLALSVKEYVANLDPDDKVSDSEYERRLNTCLECEKLFQGMCRVCGCYVEMRAALKIKHCPGSNAGW